MNNKVLSQPVRPLLKSLPLASLNAEDFELFCRDLLAALHPGADVSRYGGQGDTQDGIDLFVKKDNRLLDYQCKRHAQFGPADVTKAINDTSFVAIHHHLLLSKSATAMARKVILEREDWSLWDVEDISAKIRVLSQESALQIVRTYFPGWEKDFLGIEEPSPWLTPEEYFRPLANRVKLFSHDWSFVGRKNELQALRNFLKSDNRVAIISGRGGVGKSRLLRAFCQDQTHQVRFVSSSADIRPKDFGLLLKNGILVIDDAHESVDLGQLLKSIAIQRPELCVIISTRPYGLSQIQYELMRAGFAVESDQVINLNDLSVDDAKALSYEILAETGGNIDFAMQIAEATKDCPLATVMGSRLVASGRISPSMLNNSDNFRNKLFSTYRNIITGEIGRKNADQIRELLDLISTIQPVDPNDRTFEAVATNILDRRYDKILRDLTELENAGVLLRRRNRLRITPDLLADYIRAEATYNMQNSRPTGFADRVFDAVKDGLAANLIINLSQLDWRLSATGIQTELLNSIWSKLEIRFRGAGIYTRQAILKALEQVAYYQPAQVLKFVDVAINEPTNEVEEFFDLGFMNPSYSHVLESIPLILKYAGYNLEYLPRVLDLLRELALDDNRLTNQYPEHPLRIMTELAMVEPGKPLIYNEQILTHTLGWLEKPWTEHFSPFDVFDSLLATEGHQPELKGTTITLHPYTVRAEAVTELRTKIIEAALKTIKERSLPEAIRAVKTLNEALRGPLGQKINKEENNQWLLAHLDVLQRLKSLMEDSSLSLDPYISVAVRDAVSWHAAFSKSKTHDAAKAVLKAVPTDLRHELSRALADGWGMTFERGENQRRDEKCFIAWRIDLARKLCKEYQTNFGALIELLEERVAILNRVNLSQGSDGGPFFGSLVSQSSAFGKSLCRYILGYLDSPLTVFFGSALIALSESEYEDALSFVEEGIATGNESLLIRISWAVGWGFRASILVGEREAAIVKILMGAEQVIVRKNVVRAVARFPIDQRDNAIAMLLSMKYNDKKELADEVLQQFGEHGPFAVSDLSDAEIKEILTHLVNLDSIADYNIGNFLRALCLSHPHDVLKLLLDRVEYKENHEDLHEYDPLPYRYHRENIICLSETDAYEQLLYTVRDWSAQNAESWVRHRFGTELFGLVSAGYDEVTLKVLNEWIDSPEDRHIESAASLLSKVPRTFLWENSKYIVYLLERALQHGESCYERVSSYLYAITYEGTRSGTLGKPFPEDIEQKDESQVVMESLPYGSPGFRFYKLLYETALSNIKRIEEDDISDD